MPQYAIERVFLASDSRLWQRLSQFRLYKAQSALSKRTMQKNTAMRSGKRKRTAWTWKFYPQFALRNNDIVFDSPFIFPNWSLTDWKSWNLQHKSWKIFRRTGTISGDFTVSRKGDCGTRFAAGKILPLFCVYRGVSRRLRQRSGKWQRAAQKPLWSGFLKKLHRIIVRLEKMPAIFFAPPLPR